MDLPPELWQQVERVDRLLTTQRTMPHKLEAIAEVIERTVAGVSSVSIALVVEESTVTGAASSQLAIEADLVQYGFNQGPCLVSVQAARSVRIDVLRQDERFEHFAPGAIELGVESVLSVPLLSSSRVVGSLNLYGTEPGAFDERTLEAVAPFAGYAAEVIAHSPLYAASLDLVEGLVLAVGDAEDVQVAIGLLLGAEAADTTEEAWAELRRRALVAELSIVDLARRMVAAHEREHRSDGT